MDQEAFDDSVLGRVTPGDGPYEWRYTVPVGQREARCTIEVEDEPPVLSESILEVNRRFVAWLRAHEAEVRDHVADLFYPEWRDRWYDEEKHAALLSAQEFREAIGLSWFEADESGGGRLYYDDGGLFGDHTIAVQVNAEGRLVRPPALWG